MSDSRLHSLVDLSLDITDLSAMLSSQILGSVGLSLSVGRSCLRVLTKSQLLGWCTGQSCLTCWRVSRPASVCEGPGPLRCICRGWPPPRPGLCRTLSWRCCSTSVAQRWSPWEPWWRQWSWSPPPASGTQCRAEPGPLHRAGTCRQDVSTWRRRRRRRRRGLTWEWRSHRPISPAGGGDEVEVEQAGGERCPASSRQRGWLPSSAWGRREVLLVEVAQSAARES